MHYGPEGTGIMLMTIEVRKNPEAPAEFLRAVERAMNRGGRDTVDAVFEISQRRVPVRKGTLKKSGNVRYEQGGGRIGYNTPYARPVHEGSRPHDIYPRNKLALMFPPFGAFESMRKGVRIARFKYGGHSRKVSFVFAKHIHHPGHAPDPYLLDAINEFMPQVPELLMRIVKEEWDKIQGAKEAS